MASPNEPWILAGGKKNKPQNSYAVSKGKKKAVVENMPRIEPSRKLFNNMVSVLEIEHNVLPTILSRHLSTNQISQNSKTRLIILPYVTNESGARWLTLGWVGAIAEVPHEKVWISDLGLGLLLAIRLALG